MNPLVNQPPVALTPQAVNQPGQAGNDQAQQSQQQQQVMAQVFSNLLNKFMSSASENANNQ